MKPRIKSMIWNIRKKKKTIRATRRKKNPQENEGSLSSLWGKFKRSKIHIVGLPEGEEKDQETGKSISKNNERKLP